MKSKILIGLLVVLLSVLSGCAGATTPSATETTPPASTEEEGPSISAEDVPRITIEELKALVDSGADIVIVDDQPRSVYEQGHIKGAISLPWAMEVSEEDVQMLPRDKPIITYCDCGPGEADSADIAAKLIRKGFKDVKVLLDPSIKGWEEAGYPMGE
jgi:rhodanese-related sulfurtransferase